MRVYLSTLLSHMEGLLAESIEKAFSDEQWINLLAPARKNSIRELQGKKRENDIDTRLIDCTMITDKANVVIKGKMLRERLQPSSRDQIEHEANNVLELRNRLFHGHALLNGKSVEWLAETTAIMQRWILDIRSEKLEELADLRMRAAEAFQVHMTMPDILVSASAGVLLGLANGLFKTFIPKHGPLKHEHHVTRTAVDYQVPKPEGYHGSVQDLHRQIGPGHDIFRFKEALEMMKSGNVTDFKLWGTTATEILGHQLRPGNLKLVDFLAKGGFNIPSDPKGELLNHLLIDFFTKRSLPIPGSTYLADSSPEMAKVMLTMYDEGLNLKSALGNFIGFALVQIIVHGYTFLFKAIPVSNFSVKNISVDSARFLHV